MSVLRFTKLQNRNRWAVRLAESKHDGRDSVIGYVKCRYDFDPTLVFSPTGYGSPSFTGEQLKELGDFILSL